MSEQWSFAFILSVLSAVLFGKWTDHVKSWRHTELGDRILYITYEEMVQVTYSYLKARGAGSLWTLNVLLNERIVSYNIHCVGRQCVCHTSRKPIKIFHLIFLLCVLRPHLTIGKYVTREQTAVLNFLVWATVSDQSWSGQMICQCSYMRHIKGSLFEMSIR